MSTGVKSLAKDTVIYGATNIISKFLNWLLAPFYIRVLANSAEYGIVTNLYAWVSVILVILTLGMETGLFRFINTDEQPDRVYATTFKVVAAAVALFLVAGLLGTGSIATALGYPDHPEYIGIFVVIVALDALMSIPFAYLRYQRRPLRFAFFKFLFIALNILFNLFFLVLCPYLSAKGVALPHLIYRPDYGVGYIFVSNLLASGIEFLFMLPVLQPAFRGFDREIVKPLFRYCMPLVLLGLAGILNKMAGQILIPMLYEDRVEGMTQLGIYGGNLKIAVVMVMFIQAFRFAYDPFVFSKMKQKDGNHAYRVAMNYFILFATLIFMAVMYGIDLFKHIVAPDYYSGLVVVPIVMASEILFGIYYNLSVWYKISDRTGYGALFSVIGLAVTLIVIYWGIPRYGIVAAAWSAFACNGVMLLLSFFLGKKLHPIPYDTKQNIMLLAIAALFYFVGMAIAPPSVALRLGIRSVLLLIYMVVAIYFFAPELHQIIKKQVSR
ncbi:MAG: oligosaccharide flippase family protein [Porphyromonas sp.]|nr:oligosaccharide flippase family protein [Porphyromonas sp.]